MNCSFKMVPFCTQKRLMVTMGYCPTATAPVGVFSCITAHSPPTPPLNPLSHLSPFLPNFALPAAIVASSPPLTAPTIASNLLLTAPNRVLQSHSYCSNISFQSPTDLESSSFQSSFFIRDLHPQMLNKMQHPVVSYFNSSRSSSPNRSLTMQCQQEHFTFTAITTAVPTLLMQGSSPMAQLNTYHQNDNFQLWNLPAYA